MRAYTLDEIDRMRNVISKIEWGNYCAAYGNYHGPADPIYRIESAIPGIVEDRLRTYMTASITPEELESRYAARTERKTI